MFGRNLLVVRPKIGRSTRQSEVLGQRDIGANVEDFFDFALGEFHDGCDSRPLDFRTSSTLDGRARNLSSTMDTMAERLAHALAERHMTPPDLIKATKLSKGTVYFILDGTTKPKKVWASTVTKICNILKIERDWLLWGTGSMDSGSGKQSQANQPGATVADVADLQLAIGLLAQAVAESTPPAGRDFVALLKRTSGPLRRGTFLGELAHAVEADTPVRAIPRR